MKGCILLADGTRLEGEVTGPVRTAMGWVAANTGVVGFQEMVTDPAYKSRILAFTYPEIGNVGVTGAFSESPGVQIGGLVVKVLSGCSSHYRAEGAFADMLADAGAPCLVDVDTRGLAVHLREEGEMAAAIVPEGADLQEALATLSGLERPAFEPTDPSAPGPAASDLRLAVLDLGIRRSQLAQLSACSAPVLHPYDADADSVLAGGPAGVFVSDGPAGGLPSEHVVQTIRALLGKVPVMGCGLGHVALGMALGCDVTFLKRGHHGANYPVRNLMDGRVEVTQQRHTVVLERESVQGSPEVELLWENINDGTVEGIRRPDGSAVGLQAILAAPQVGLVNAQIRQFIDALAEA